MKVLVVDDSRAMRSIMKKALAFAGIGDNVFEAEHGQAALIVVEAESPDLIVSDVNMPVMGGDVLLDELKSSGRLDSTRVVMVTSTVGAQAALDLVRRGASKVLRKPFNPTSLHSELAEFLVEPSEPDTFDEELDGGEVEFMEEPAPEELDPAIAQEALESLGRVLERSLHEFAELLVCTVPNDTILLATTIDMDEPFAAELTLLTSYDVATRLAEELTGDPPEDDVTRLDALAELLNVMVGDFANAISPNGVRPGMFGLPRIGVVSPGDMGDEEWACARLSDPDGDVYLRLVPRTWEAA